MDKLLDIAWCAGFFDGEGCIYQSKKGAVKLSIQQNEVTSLQKFQNTMGGKIYGPYTRVRSRDPGRISNPYWVWQNQNPFQVEFVLRGMLPFLTVKHEKAIQVLGD